MSEIRVPFVCSECGSTDFEIQLAGGKIIYVCNGCDHDWSPAVVHDWLEVKYTEVNREEAW